nr:5503_t:CDS:2 [Entrophospora candida]
MTIFDIIKFLFQHIVVNPFASGFLLLINNKKTGKYCDVGVNTGIFHSVSVQTGDFVDSMPQHERLSLSCEDTTILQKEVVQEFKTNLDDGGITNTNTDVNVNSILEPLKNADGVQTLNNQKITKFENKFDSSGLDVESFDDSNFLNDKAKIIKKDYLDVQSTNVTNDNLSACSNTKLYKHSRNNISHKEIQIIHPSEVLWKTKNYLNNNNNKRTFNSRPRRKGKKCSEYNDLAKSAWDKLIIADSCNDLNAVKNAFKLYTKAAPHETYQSIEVKLRQKNCNSKIIAIEPNEILLTKNIVDLQGKKEKKYIAILIMISPHRFPQSAGIGAKSEDENFNWLADAGRYVDDFTTPYVNDTYFIISTIIEIKNITYGGFSKNRN